MTMIENLSEPLTEAEDEELDKFLLALGGDDSILGMSAFDGFITAIVSGPEPIMPSVWLDAIWDGEDNAPEWESIEQYQQIFGLMIRHMNSTIATLLEAPDEYEPIFLETTVDRVNHLVVDECCLGYLRGVELYPDHTISDAFMQGALEPMIRFAEPADPYGLAEKSDQEIRELQEQIAPAALDIHAYWLERRTTSAIQQATYHRPAPKVGRNDPCPCGSGKKYKKCCGVVH